MAARSDVEKEKVTRTEGCLHGISAESCRMKETDKENAKLKLEIDGKHKEKNEKLLSKSRQSIVVAGNSTKLNSINPSLSGKLALSRQKEVQIYDSHAIDFGQIRKSKLPDDVLDNAFLPRHLRKRVSSLQGRSKLNNTRRPSRLELKSEEGRFAEERVFHEESSKDACDGRRTLSIVSEHESRTNDCFSQFGHEKECQHDTLEAFGKYRMQKLDRDKRLRKIQEEARLVDNKTNEPIVKSLAYRKQLSLPALDECQTGAESIKTYTRKRDRYKLPRLKNIHTGDTKKEPSRFDKLLSSLVPQDKRHIDFQRRRHFTL